MQKSALAIAALGLTGMLAPGAQNPPTTPKNVQVTLRWFGTAGWEISDGSTIILIDSYLSRLNGPRPPGAGSAGTPLPGDTRKLYGWDDVIVHDEAVIDAHIQRANFVLVTHTH